MAVLTVDRNPQQVTNLLHLAASQFERSQIPQNEMVICPVRLQLVPMRRKSGGQSLCVQNNLLSVCAESGLGHLEESSGNSSNCLMRKKVRKVVEQSWGKLTLL